MQELPDQIKHFKIIKKLGTGKDSVVLHVQDGGSGRDFALKIINKTCPTRYTKNEISALSLLAQYSIEPKLHDVFEANGSTYLLLQLMSGWDLIKYIKLTGSMNFHQAMIFLKQMLNILRIMRDHQLLHLDIKPNNILYDSGRFFLCDWGRSEQGTRVATLNIFGNSIYFAPEGYLGSRSFASEIYSLGCVLYFAVTGKTIYGLDIKHEFVQKMYAHFYYQPEFPKTVSPKLAFLIKAMLEKNPNRRITLEKIEDLINLDKDYQMDYSYRNEAAEFSSPLSILQKLAEAGIPYALNILARKYREGKVLPRDLTKFVTLNNLAAKSNLVRSISDLGEAKLLGLGIAKNYEEAFNLFQYAANSNFDFAQYQLALLYKEGAGVKRDPLQADYWLKRAAENGNLAAKNLLNYQ